jgi:glycosyltransferase involved in cell wall biosynthesis
MLDNNRADTTRIAILSSASGGGAGIAAKRLADTLDKEADLSADFVCGDTLGSVKAPVFLPFEVAPQKSMSNRRLTDTHYTIEYPGYQRPWLTDLLKSYDFVNTHWSSYLISLAELDTISRHGTPMLFMFHDFHYMTGGCHYPAGCEGLYSGCWDCPQIDHSLCESSFVLTNYRLKRQIFARTNVHMAAPSQYLRDQAVKAGLVPENRAHVLRNPYVPHEPANSSATDAPVRVMVIADSLSEQRKGMPLAVDALKALNQLWQDRGETRSFRVELVGAANEALTQKLNDSGVDYHLHGRLTDHAKIVDVFNQCDVLLTCSYEDNWPNILVEGGSYDCIPVVGPGHGCQEFVETYGLGAVAPDYTAPAFAEALFQTMSNRPSAERLLVARNRIRQDHELGRVTAQYREIMAKVMATAAQNALAVE